MPRRDRYANTLAAMNSRIPTAWSGVEPVKKLAIRVIHPTAMTAGPFVTFHSGALIRDAILTLLIGHLQPEGTLKIVKNL